MKNLWIGKKRSLLWFGGALLLVAIIASFIASRSPAGFKTLPSITVTATSPSHLPRAPQAVSKVRTFDNAGASAPNNLGAPAAMPGPTLASASNGPTDSGASGGQKNQSGDIGPQYLVKTLNVDLQVKDTRKVADNLLTWITRTDPRATSTGTDYEQVGDNLYNVSLTFSVQATLYPQVYRYLRDYTTHNGGHLATFNESIQDVTGSYVDTQSRLQNLRVEQGRLQDLLSHAQALSDILSIDQQLTNVEGQIESYEAQLKTLTSQVTFYTVSVSLEPIETAAPPPSNNGWTIGKIFHDAFSASLAFGQGGLALLVYLVAFSLYGIPLAIIIWLARKLYIRARQAALPKVATETSDLANEGATEDSASMHERVTEDSVPVHE